MKLNLIFVLKYTILEILNSTIQISVGRLINCFHNSKNLFFQVTCVSKCIYTVTQVQEYQHQYETKHTTLIIVNVIITPQLHLPNSLNNRNNNYGGVIESACVGEQHHSFITLQPRSSHSAVHL